MCILTVSVPLFMTAEAQATIYKCVNTNAEVYYNDKPCPVTDIERQIKAAKDPVDGYIPPAFVADDKKVGAKGVLVGGNEDNQNNLSDKNKSDNVTNGSGNSSTDNSADNVNNDSNESDKVSNSKTNSSKRIRNKAARQEPLPTIPLNVEENAKETRSKLI